MYRKISTGWLKHWEFELADLICIEVAFFLSYYLRHKSILQSTIDWYVKLGCILLIVDIVVVFFSNNYKDIIHRSTELELWSVLKHVTVIELIFIFYEFIMKEATNLSRFVILVSWGLGVVFCFFSRLVLRYFMRKRITKEINQAKMLVITTKSRVMTCISQVLSREIRNYRVTCIAMPTEDEVEIKHLYNFEFIYGNDKLWEYLRTNVIDEVFIDTFSTQEELNILVERLLAMGITVHIGMGFLPKELPNQFVEKLGEAYVLTTSIKTARTWEIATKRMIDITGALVGLMLMGIAYLFVAPIIKKESPGPVFFKQKRVGRNGRTFYIYKFRSMYMDAEERKKELMKHNEMQGLMFKMENDPRIIGSEKGPGKGIGNFIRKTSIDELPQFWNILKGDMSLVGTRPPTVQEYEQYELHHKIRLSMKPGLTGMWQASGRSDITDFEEIVKLDAKYIENWSLKLDVQLILKTIMVVLKREGSK